MPHWRPAEPGDDDSIVTMCLDLYSDAPGHIVTASQVRRTLEVFRHEPLRGRVVVLDDRGRCGGYALLASFWSNELGGEICTIDELYIDASLRGQGHATALVTALRSGAAFWPERPVALELEVAPANTRARVLYERLGFRVKRNTTLRLGEDEE